MSEPPKQTPDGQRLNLNLCGTDNTTSPKKFPRLPLGKNRETILEEIAARWHSKGLYATPGQALQALLGNGINLVTITMPVNFLSGIHDQIPEGILRDVVGQIYFGEEISPENKTALHYAGINATLIFIHRGNKS
jgi:hypothetical protein